VGLLTWLGLKQGNEYPNLDALVGELRRALPDDESVLLRYVAIVIVLLGRVALADGRLRGDEERTVRELLTHVGRLSPANIDAICARLQQELPDLESRELDVCYRELRALCDSKERAQILALLEQVAAADGDISDDERRELWQISRELGLDKPS
jgi:DnaJ like chaperone protein